MNLNVVISEAPNRTDKNMVPMGGGQNVDPAMGDQLDDRPIGSDASKQGKSPEGEISSQHRVALAQILDGDQQAVTEVIRAMSFLKDKKGHILILYGDVPNIKASTLKPIIDEPKFFKRGAYRKSSTRSI